MRLKRAPSSDLLSAAGRTAHDLGLAGLLGGNFFGRFALHPSVTAISDKRERGKVVDAAWRRYGTVNSLSLAALCAGWLGARATEVTDRNLSATEATLVRAKDVLVAAVAVAGLVTAAEGVRFARQAPEGAVPLESGSEPAPETPRESARMKRILNALGRAGALAEVALVAVNAALAQENFRRPPRRRALPWFPR